MSASQRDDVDYPYSPRPAAVLVPIGRSTEAAALPRPSWHFVGKWLLRLAFLAAVMFAIAMIPVGIVAYRARSQAAVIERLESLGCRVDYLGQYRLDYRGQPIYSGLNGQVQHYLRKKFGDQHFGDVFLVSALGLDPSIDASEVCKLCSRFKRLKHFEIGSESFRFDQITKWRQLDNLNSLTIYSPTLTDADLARIGQMPALQTLELKAPKVTSAGLRHLNGAAELTALTMYSAALDGESTANEKGFPKLGRLDVLQSPQIGDNAIVGMGPLPELTHVTFLETHLGDVAIKHVAGGGKLYSATLSGTKVTDEGLASLAKCSELFSLELARTEVTDAGIAALATCPNLNDINVAETMVTGKGLSVLAGSNLTLRMDRCPVSLEGLRDVLKIPGLSELSLEDANVMGAGLGDMQAGSLYRINLAGTPLTREGIEGLAKSLFPNLCLARTPIDDKALMLFVDNDALVSLDVSETKVTAAGVKAFYEARKLRLAAAGKEESLYLTCDHPDIVEQYISELGMAFPGFDPSLQPDGSVVPASSEPPPDTTPQTHGPPHPRQILIVVGTLRVPSQS